MNTWEYLKRVNNNSRSLSPKNILKLANMSQKTKRLFQFLEGIDTILGINVIILRDDKEKAERLNFYFTFIFYVKDKD